MNKKKVSTTKLVHIQIKVSKSLTPFIRSRTGIPVLYGEKGYLIRP